MEGSLSSRLLKIKICSFEEVTHDELKLKNCAQDQRSQSLKRVRITKEPLKWFEQDEKYFRINS